jgi:hypothetical protein
MQKNMKGSKLTEGFFYISFFAYSRSYFMFGICIIPIFLINYGLR